MNVVLMGMPGVGKGTQGARLREAVGAVHVSTGDILREAVRSRSALGSQVKACLDSGALVPDALIGELVGERLSRSDARKGFILDGFPRTVEQVGILDRVLGRIGLQIDRVVLLGAPEEEIVRRLTGRRICPNAKCAEVYHLEKRPPRSAGVCDRCGSALTQRPDDTEEVIRERLDVFARQTLPAAEAYRERGILVEVDGVGHPDEVFVRMEGELKGP